MAQQTREVEQLEDRIVSLNNKIRAQRASYRIRIEAATQKADQLAANLQRSIETLDEEWEAIFERAAIRAENNARLEAKSRDLWEQQRSVRAMGTEAPEKLDHLKSLAAELSRMRAEIDRSEDERGLEILAKRECEKTARTRILEDGQTTRQILEDQMKKTEAETEEDINALIQAIDDEYKKQLQKIQEREEKEERNALALRETEARHMEKYQRRREENAMIAMKKLGLQDDEVALVEEIERLNNALERSIEERKDLCSQLEVLRGEEEMAEIEMKKLNREREAMLTDEKRLLNDRANMEAAKTQLLEKMGLNKTRRVHLVTPPPSANTSPQPQQTNGLQKSNKSTTPRSSAEPSEKRTQMNTLFDGQFQNIQLENGQSQATEVHRIAQDACRQNAAALDYIYHENVGPDTHSDKGLRMDASVRDHGTRNGYDPGTTALSTDVVPSNESTSRQSRCTSDPIKVAKSTMAQTENSLRKNSSFSPESPRIQTDSPSRLREKDQKPIYNLERLAITWQVTPEELCDSLGSEACKSPGFIDALFQIRDRVTLSEAKKHLHWIRDKRLKSPYKSSLNTAPKIFQEVDVKKMREWIVDLNFGNKIGDFDDLLASDSGHVISNGDSPDDDIQESSDGDTIVLDDVDLIGTGDLDPPELAIANEQIKKITQNPNSDKHRQSRSSSGSPPKAVRFCFPNATTQTGKGGGSTEDDCSNITTARKPGFRKSLPPSFAARLRASSVGHSEDESSVQFEKGRPNASYSFDRNENETVSRSKKGESSNPPTLSHSTSNKRSRPTIYDNIPDDTIISKRLRSRNSTRQQSLPAWGR